jgi:predicted amidohydrolase YtcJ
LSASLVLRRGRIYTLGPGAAGPFRPQPFEAIALRNGRIVAAGSDAAVAAEVTEDCPTVDLGGRTVLPGFTDGHVHWASYALTRKQLNLTPDQSLPDVLRSVRHAIAHLTPDQWLVGRGWDHARWGRWPTSVDLDGAAPSNPVALMRKDGHAMWVNSRALDFAGLDVTTQPPDGGEIGRANGGLSGILKETATQLVRRVVPEPEPVDRQAALVDSWPDAWSLGITGCHDMGGTGGGALFRDIATLRDAGELGLRFVWYFPESALDEAIGLGLRSGLGDDWLRVGGLKLFLDGTLGSLTADLLEPYSGRPAERGLATLEPEAFLQLVRQAEAARLAVAVHAIGDGAARKALDVFAHVRREFPGSSRLAHRIEHLQLVHPTDIGRFDDLDVTASVQPAHYIADHDMAVELWSDRESVPYPWRSLERAGARLAFGSDAPVESPNVFAGIHAAVQRKPSDKVEGWHPEEAVSVASALVAYTAGPAVASGQEKSLGSLLEGRRADLIVLDVDPFECSPERLADIQVLATMIDGVWVWQLPEVDFAGPRN